MRYWWVNQNQTYRQEIEGGYLWSPKRNQDGRRNPFYEFMREVAPGDLIFSFADTRIRTFGTARSFAYEAPKPTEFGNVGTNWERIGWKVEVAYHRADPGFRPADRMERLRPLLPDKYSPLLADGRGVQAIYLTELPERLARVLAEMLGPEIAALARAETIAERELFVPKPDLARWEEHLRNQIVQDDSIPETEREALVLARRGQGRFRSNVQRIESQCRVTRVDRPEHLRASHCKPWRDCSNEERLDGENGLLLTPSIDHVFDGGFISFAGDGDLLISPVAHKASLQKMGLPVDRALNVGAFTSRQREYLEYHRDAVFLRASVSN